MKRHARVVSTLLAALLACYALCACGDPGDPEPAASGDSGVGVEETDNGTERIADALPELNYKDREVVILSRYVEGWTSGEIGVPELINEPVNDAVYDRNKTVEDRLHVRLNSLELHEYSTFLIPEKVAQAVKTGTRDYHIAAGPCYTTVTESLNGTFANLRDAQYLDFEKPWWSQGFNDVVEYHGAQFEMTGAALLSMYRFSFVTVFNQRLFEQVGQPFLYDAVNQGKWTIDYQTSLLDQFHTDNGNGQQDEEEDVYGLVTGSHLMTDPYWSACKIPIIKKDEYGDYQYVLDINLLHEVADKVLRMFYQTNDATYVYPVGEPGYEPGHIRDMFADGRAAMATIRLMEAETGIMRGMKDRFGIVPMPKYDEQQDGYRTLMHDEFTVLFVPGYMTGKDLDMVGAVLEALSSDSYYRVKPAYYELTLRTKIAQDPESALMLDIVMDNIYIDAGIIYTTSLESFHNNFRAIIRSGENTVMSTFRSVSRTTEKQLRQLKRKFNRIIR